MLLLLFLELVPSLYFQSEIVHEQAEKLIIAKENMIDLLWDQFTLVAFTQKYEHNGLLQSHQIRVIMPPRERDQILRDYYRIHLDSGFVIFHIHYIYNPQSASHIPLDNRMYRMATLDILLLVELLPDLFESDNSHFLHPNS